MGWGEVVSDKATEAQIKYAEALLEARYGEILEPIYTMTKHEISLVIDESKEWCEENHIDYHTKAPTRLIRGNRRLIW